MVSKARERRPSSATFSGALLEADDEVGQTAQHHLLAAQPTTSCWMIEEEEEENWGAFKSRTKAARGQGQPVWPSVVLFLPASVWVQTRFLARPQWSSSSSSQISKAPTAFGLTFAIVWHWWQWLWRSSKGEGKKQEEEEEEEVEVEEARTAIEVEWKRGFVVLRLVVVCWTLSVSEG